MRSDPAAKWLSLSLAISLAQYVCVRVKRETTAIYLWFSMSVSGCRVSRNTRYISGSICLCHGEERNNRYISLAQYVGVRVQGEEKQPLYLWLSMSVSGWRETTTTPPTHPYFCVWKTPFREQTMVHGTHLENAYTVLFHWPQRHVLKSDACV